VSLKQKALNRLESHWAVAAITAEDRKRAFSQLHSRLVTKAVGRQLHLPIEESTAVEDLQKRVAMAYEMAAIDGLPALLNQSSEQDEMRWQCVAGAWRTFEFRRLMSIPTIEEERIFHVLHLAGLAYCGDRWSDIRRWFIENSDAIQVPSVADKPWHSRLLIRLFECWIRLLRKQDWDDVDRIREIIAGLREDQIEHERTSLDSGSNALDRAMALRLIALYNWAKATELLARYVLQGEPRGIHVVLDKHFEAATDAATASGDASLEVLTRWLHASSRQMVSGSLWWVAHSINSRVTRFVGSVAKHQSMFELLPPQRAALQEQGLLDIAATAVVVDLPTSGGKTLLAQFRILQALNQFAENGGWVAYVVPTKALGNQITRRLRRDFDPIGVRVEQLTGAVEIDAVEEGLLSSTDTGEKRAFDVLVATPEKLQLVVRNKKVSRPLSLLVMDEAHNMESETRGLRIELLLATIKQESVGTNFLLLMPFVERADVLARWLASDPNAGRTISLGTSPWRPNEQMIGIFRAKLNDEVSAGWQMEFESLLTTRKTLHLSGTHPVGSSRPLPPPRSRLLSPNGDQKGFGLQAAAMAKEFSGRGTSIAIGTDPANAWSMAREIVKAIPTEEATSSRVQLVQRFLEAEVSPDFELINMLSHGVGVHHAGLSDEVRSLIEWLTEEGDIKVLCATTTLAQGINFPVSSVFLARPEYRLRKFPYKKEMAAREFWNLAGRAGRMNQDSVGVVGIAGANREDEIKQYVRDAAGEIVSQLVGLVATLDNASSDEELLGVMQAEQWEDFRCYVNHLVHEIGNLDRVIANVEDSLRNTYGYRALQNSTEGKARAQKLIEATKAYARRLSQNMGQVARADSTGFSFEGVGRALSGIRELNRELTPSDFSAESLFGSSHGMAELYGIMLKVPQLARNLDDLTTHGQEHQHLSAITQDWVDGKSIQEIAKSYFRADENPTQAITEACKAIYRNLVNNGTWGLSALSRLSGIDFDNLSEEQKHHINLLPAMIYHGVRTEEGVLMRMNGVPRSIAETMGGHYRRRTSDKSERSSSIHEVRQFIASADIETWNRARPANSPLSAKEYRDIWSVLSGAS